VEPRVYAKDLPPTGPEPSCWKIPSTDTVPDCLSNDLTPGGKFPRLTKNDAKGRVKEIKKLLLAL
jgi:hypothetical protein